MHFNTTIRARLEQPRPLAETPGVSGGRSSKELWGHSHSTPTCPQQTPSFLPTHSANITSPSPAGLCVGCGGEGWAFWTGDLDTGGVRAPRKLQPQGGPLDPRPPQAFTWISRTCSVKSGSNLKREEGREQECLGKPAGSRATRFLSVLALDVALVGWGLHPAPPSACPARTSTPRAAAAVRLPHSVTASDIQSLLSSSN